MSGDTEPFFWQSDPEWYRVNNSGDIEMTEKAPERAVKSFESWKRPRSEKKNPFIGKTEID